MGGRQPAKGFPQRPVDVETSLFFRNFDTIDVLRTMSQGEKLGRRNWPISLKILTHRINFKTIPKPIT